MKSVVQQRNTVCTGAKWDIADVIQLIN